MGQGIKIFIVNLHHDAQPMIKTIDQKESLQTERVHAAGSLDHLGRFSPHLLAAKASEARAHSKSSYFIFCSDQLCTLK